MSHIIGHGRYAKETYPSAGQRGPQGPQGAPGIGTQGPPGAQGEQGPQGPPLGGFGLFSARPAAGVQGAHYVASDGSTEWVDTGVVQAPLLFGTPGQQVPLVASFTPYGTGVGSLTWQDRAGTIVGITEDVGDTAGIVAAKGGTCDVIGHFNVRPGNDSGYGGLVVRDSGSERAVYFATGTNGAIQVSLWDTNTVFSTDTYTGPGGCQPFWFRFVDDGVNFKHYTSPNRLDWFLVHQSSRTEWLPGGGDQLGIGIVRTGGLIIVCDDLQG